MATTPHVPLVGVTSLPSLAQSTPEAGYLDTAIGRLDGIVRRARDRRTEVLRERSRSSAYDQREALRAASESLLSEIADAIRNPVTAIERTLKDAVSNGSGSAAITLDDARGSTWDPVREEWTPGGTGALDAADLAVRIDLVRREVTRARGDHAATVAHAIRNAIAGGDGVPAYALESLGPTRDLVLATIGLDLEQLRLEYHRARKPGAFDSLEAVRDLASHLCYNARVAVNEVQRVMLGASGTTIAQTVMEALLTPIEALTEQAST